MSSGTRVICGYADVGRSAAEEFAARAFRVLAKHGNHSALDRLGPVQQDIRFPGLQDHPTPTPTVSNDSKPLQGRRVWGG
ncbi:hypothetical protein GCM10022247_05700 [Allokutzneria multivorans]|uniref:Uncharacterized protein n=1 Tax=Allokutzneria multivorans TaxID=1142134 RepID=A0ABP7R0I8_9PSEU